MLSNKEIINLFDIPRTTVYNWKNSKDWRHKLYLFLASMDKETALNKLTLDKEIALKEAELLELKSKANNHELKQELRA